MGAVKELGAITEESLSAIKVVVSFAQEKHVLEKFLKSAMNMKTKSLTFDKTVAKMGGVFTFLIFGFYVIALYMGSFFIEHDVENVFRKKTYNVSAILIVLISLITGLMVSLGMMPNIS